MEQERQAWLDDKHVKYDYVDYDLADEGLQTHIQEEMLARGASAFPFVKFGAADFIIGYNPDATRDCWGCRGRPREESARGRGRD